MKKYKEITVTKKEIANVICNGCGKEINQYADYFGVDKTWGYGTDYDGESHRFDLCEQCYNKLIASLAIPIDRE